MVIVQWYSPYLAYSRPWVPTLKNELLICQSSDLFLLTNLSLPCLYVQIKLVSSHSHHDAAAPVQTSTSGWRHSSCWQITCLNIWKAPNSHIKKKTKNQKELQSSFSFWAAQIMNPTNRPPSSHTKKQTKQNLPSSSTPNPPNDSHFQPCSLNTHPQICHLCEVFSEVSVSF